MLLAIPIAFFGSFAVINAVGPAEQVSMTEMVVMTFGAIAGTSFIGVAAFLFGIVASVWQKWNKFHGFTLAADDRAGRLQIAAGSPATRRQTIRCGGSTLCRSSSHVVAPAALGDRAA